VLGQDGVGILGGLRAMLRSREAMPVGMSRAEGRPFYASGAAGRLRDRLARE